MKMVRSHRMLIGLVLGVLILIGAAPESMSQTFQGPAIQVPLMPAPSTTNTTLPAVRVPDLPKSIQCTVSGTGSVAQTFMIYGNSTNTNTGGVPLNTAWTITGTTTATDALPTITATFPWLYVTTSGTTGTGAGGLCLVNY